MIKKELLLFFAFILLFSCDNLKKQTSDQNVIEEKQEGDASIGFEKTVHDFGEINRGEVVTFTFIYTNNGSADLIVKDVKASCGCTTPDWTKEPVKPGEKGKIVVSFDSSGRSGNQIKYITIYSNSKNENDRLTIKAKII